MPAQLTNNWLLSRVYLNLKTEQLGSKLIFLVWPDSSEKMMKKKDQSRIVKVLRQGASLGTS